jgi:acylphosphatase
MSQPGPDAERRRVLYRGRVQGVGFRFTARQTAQRFAVQGFVRNLRSGDVELVAEGTPDELDRFLAAVAAAMEGYIDSAEVTRSSATGEFAAFEVRP